MFTLRLLVIGTAVFAFVPAAPAQLPPAKPPGAAAKAKPFSSSDTRIYIALAEDLQFQLKAMQKLRGKFKETNPGLVSFSSKISKEVIDLYTPGVTMAQEHGVPGMADKKSKSGTIPVDATAADTALITKVDAAHKGDEQKWIPAFFEMLSKELKKKVVVAEKNAKAVQDADLKVFADKAVAMLKSQSETVDAKLAEVKPAK